VDCPAWRLLSMEREYCQVSGCGVLQAPTSGLCSSCSVWQRALPGIPGSATGRAFAAWASTCHLAWPHPTPAACVVAVWRPNASQTMVDFHLRANKA
jgi:hypothetical protein